MEQSAEAGRREMNMETFVAFHPCLHVWMFVRGVIVANDVDLFIGRRIAFDQVQADEFWRSKPRKVAKNRKTADRSEPVIRIRALSRAA